MPVGDFVGIQIGPVSFVDEGVAAVLDTVQERASVNALLLAPLTWDSTVAGRAQGGTPGHGIVGSYDAFGGGAFWEPNAVYYEQSTLRDFRARDPVIGDFDVLRAVIPAARERDMKVYPYLFETGVADRPRGSPGFVQVSEVDGLGRKAHRPCLFNPDYKTWIFSVVEDLCQSLDIDGILWGLERQGPLMNTLETGAVPACFCEHCHRVAASSGIDMERARSGYMALYQYLQAVTGGDVPADGYFVSFLRIILNYPELLQWEKRWVDEHKRFQKEMYGLVKFLDPSKQVGLGLWYRITTTNPYLRAQYEYSEFIDSCDWVKPILYHVPTGARLARWLTGLQATILADSAAGDWLKGLYRIMQHDEAPFNELPEAGFSADYVRRETARAVAGFASRAKVYPAIGVGMSNPGGRAITPEDIGPAIHGAQKGGADGVLLCRMYAEMPLANLDAAGAALRELRQS
jgi:hypothetical protein